MKKDLFVTSVLAVVLLSSAFFSLAAAQDDTIPVPSAIPDQRQPYTSDNSTITQNGDGVLYTIQDNSTDTQREPAPDVPGAEDANLTAAQSSSDKTLPIVLGAVVLAVAACAIGFFGWRRKVR
jgi:hypothetical protein